MTAGDDGMSKYFAGLPDQKTGKSKRVKAETGATDITAPVCGATVPAGVDQSLLDLLLSSDSSLSDVPSDVSSITVDSSPPSPTLVTAGGQLDSPSSVPQTPTKSARPPPAKKSRRKLPKFSPYFPKPSGDAESCLPFPPISAESFGLIQEQLAHNPFRLLLATIFLNRTRGGVAIPVLFRVFERYPTVEAMAAADVADVVETIHCLGFQNQRAKKCIELAKTWLVAPPTKGKRYRKLNYPKKGDGRDVGPDECIDDDDPRVAWEIAHLPGIGTYAIDSWRIFCRDELRGVASDWKGTNPSAAAAAAADFEPEWKRVLPTDKELRAYLTWMWLKEGWIWDRETGKRTRASEEMMRAAARGGLAHEKDGNWVLEMSPVKVSAYE